MDSDKMDIELAKEKIKNHNIKIEEEKKQKEIKIQKQTEEYITEIKQLKPRIEKIIEIGNLCIKNNINIEKNSTKAKYENNVFITDAIHHQLGFYPNNWDYSTFKCTKYDYIGFQNGGFYEDWDFITDGKDIFEVHEDRDRITPIIDDYATYRKPTIYQMSKFLNYFDEFEKTFYNFINNL